MSDSRIATGIRVGSLAAATTIGAVMGLGLRHGLALRPFSSTGGAVLAKLGLAATPTTSIIAGLAAVTGAVVVLGVCFTVVAAALRGARLLVVALVFGALAWAVTAYVVPSVLVLSSGAVLGDAQRAFIFALLALALVVGMRLARSATDID
jgi:hypothetical protein